MKYLNETCPVCSKRFTQDDDVVVCPTCGTPHHRECYKANGTCANEALHSQSFEWEPQEKEPEQKPFQEKVNDGHNIVFCPNCGRENPAEEPNCIYCSTRLYNNGPLSQPVNLPNMANQQFGTQIIEISPNDTIGSNKVSDVAEYVQLNANKYIPQFFKSEKTGKKLQFNWAAFLFSPYWFFFRKMNVIGFVLILLSLFITGGCSTQRLSSTMQRYETAMEEYYNGEISQEEMAKVSQDFAKTPEVIIMLGSEIAIRLFSGFFANELYKRKIEKDINEIKKNSASPEDYRLKIFKKGGVSGLMFGLAFVGQYCAEQILLMFITKGS